MAEYSVKVACGGFQSTCVARAQRMAVSLWGKAVLFCSSLVVFGIIYLHYRLHHKGVRCRVGKYGGKVVPTKITYDSSLRVELYIYVYNTRPLVFTKESCAVMTQWWLSQPSRTYHPPVPADVVFDAIP